MTDGTDAAEGTPQQNAQTQQDSAGAEGEPAEASACPHPEAIGKRWGDPIGVERQGEL